MIGKKSGNFLHGENPRNCHASLPTRPLKSEVVNLIFTGRTEIDQGSRG